jgi:hypothetical protein
VSTKKQFTWPEDKFILRLRIDNRTNRSFNAVIIWVHKLFVCHCVLCFFFTMKNNWMNCGAGISYNNIGPLEKPQRNKKLQNGNSLKVFHSSTRKIHSYTHSSTQQLHLTWVVCYLGKANNLMDWLKYQCHKSFGTKSINQKILTS